MMMMTSRERQSLITLLRSEIVLTRQIAIIKAELLHYFHDGDFTIEELEDCERAAQDLELD